MLVSLKLTVLVSSRGGRVQQGDGACSFAGKGSSPLQLAAVWSVHAVCRGSEAKGRRARVLEVRPHSSGMIGRGWVSICSKTGKVKQGQGRDFRCTLRRKFL